MTTEHKREKNRLELRKIMEQNEMKSPAVAQLMGKRPQTVRKYMCGVTFVSDDFLNSLKYKLMQQNPV